MLKLPNLYPAQLTDIQNAVSEALVGGTHSRYRMMVSMQGHAGIQRQSNAAIQCQLLTMVTKGRLNAGGNSGVQRQCIKMGGNAWGNTGVQIMCSMVGAMLEETPGQR